MESAEHAAARGGISSHTQKAAILSHLTQPGKKEEEGAWAARVVCCIVSRRFSESAVRVRKCLTTRSTGRKGYPQTAIWSSPKSYAADLSELVEGLRRGAGGKAECKHQPHGSWANERSRTALIPIGLLQIEMKSSTIMKALQTGIVDLVRAATMFRSAERRPKMRITRKARITRRTETGRLMGPSATRERLITIRSNRL